MSLKQLINGKYNDPTPEVGKIYKAFDDGKVRFSRLCYWRIDKEINLDTEDVEPELLKIIANEVNSYYWLFSPEQHIIYKATMVNKDGSVWFYKSTEPTECYFLRTDLGEWFGTGYLGALLDIDDYYYNKYLAEDLNDENN